MQWQKEDDLAVRAVRAAGARLLEIARGEKTVLSAHGRDIKLQADRDAETTIIDLLRRESDYPILAEESGEHGLADDALTNGQPFWVIDPLDGTWNYKRGVPMCCSSLALVRDGEPLLGAIFDFNHGDLYHGIVGEGAWDGAGNQIHVSDVTEAAKGTLATGFPVLRDLGPESMQWLWRQAGRFKKIRMLGTAALMCAYVACGKVDAYAEDEIMLWDVAAGLALIKAAGGYLHIEPSSAAKWARKIRSASHPNIWAEETKN